MTTEYHVTVWRRAMVAAEADVMRATTIHPGGRNEGEALLAYVERATKIQAAAAQRWLTARAEVEAAEKAYKPPPGSLPRIGG